MMEYIERTLEGLEMMDDVYDLEEDIERSLEVDMVTSDVWNNIRSEDYGVELMDYLDDGDFSKALEFYRSEVDE